MKKYTIPGLKLSGTSFLLPAGYVPGVRFTAERCEDVALLLMETGTGGEFLPTAEEIREIGKIVDGEGASLHLHLPTDEDFDTPEGTRAMVAKVRNVVDLTAPLGPHSFVLHLNFPLLNAALFGENADKGRGLPDGMRHWTAQALREIAACLPSPEQLAVENLETYPTNFWDGWLEGKPGGEPGDKSYSRCLDIGHIWKDGNDPAPVLEAWLSRVRVIHLHGLEPRETETSAAPGDGFCGKSAGFAASDLLRRFGPRPRDHRSLRLMPPDCIDAVMHPLWRAKFAGVLVLEVFSFDDFSVSHAALLRSWERYAPT